MLHEFSLEPVLYDRSYMKNPFNAGLSSWTDRVLIILTSFFLLDAVFKLFGISSSLKALFSCSGNSITSGYIWSFFTYSLFHEGPLHLIFNLLGIHFIARKVETLINPKLYLSLILLSIFLGSVFWIFFNYTYGNLIGASAFVMGSLTFFCLLQPNSPITFLLFFILPVSLKPMYLLLGVLGIELYGFVFSELAGTSNIAHSAHLGGMVAGLLLFYCYQGKINFPNVTFNFNSTKTKTKQNKPHKYSIHKQSSGDFEIQVDKILDKINEKGFGSLTNDEKDVLDRAKKLFKSNEK